MHNYSSEKVLYEANNNSFFSIVANILKSKKAPAKFRRGLAGSTVIVATALVLSTAVGSNASKGAHATDPQPLKSTQPITSAVNNPSSNINVQGHTESESVAPSNITDESKAKHQVSVTAGGESIEAKNNETVHRIISDVDGTTRMDVSVQSSQNGESSSQAQIRSLTSSYTSSSSISVHSGSNIISVGGQ